MLKDFIKVADRPQEVIEKTVEKYQEALDLLTK